MPRFFIHAHGPKRSIPDRDGVLLDDVPTARALALLAVVDALDDRDDIRGFLDWRFEVMDDAGQSILTIPFLDCAFAWRILRARG